MTPSLVVLGATGGIGRGVVAAAVAAGRPVIAIARDATALRDLRQRHPDADIVALPASVASDGDAADLARRLLALGRPLDGVVVAVGGELERGRLLDQPADFLRRKLDEDLLPHLFAARHLLPLLAESMRDGYVLIGGPGANHPWASYGHCSIAAAALRMFARVLHDEARAFSVRVQLLTVDSPACTERNRDHACPQWPSALSIGRRALALIDRSAANAPAQAVVPFVTRALSPSFLSDDIDQDMSASTAGIAPQEADGTNDANAQRSLRDARALLDTLLPAPRPQETPSS